VTHWLKKLSKVSALSVYYINTFEACAPRGCPRRSRAGHLSTSPSAAWGGSPSACGTPWGAYRSAERKVAKHETGDQGVRGGRGEDAIGSVRVECATNQECAMQVRHEWHRPRAHSTCLDTARHKSGRHCLCSDSFFPWHSNGAQFVALLGNPCRLVRASSR
jgi:hypothetical protein